MYAPLSHTYLVCSVIRYGSILIGYGSLKIQLWSERCFNVTDQTNGAIIRAAEYEKGGILKKGKHAYQEKGQGVRRETILPHTKSLQSLMADCVEFPTKGYATW